MHNQLINRILNIFHRYCCGLFVKFGVFLRQSQGNITIECQMLKCLLLFDRFERRKKIAQNLSNIVYSEIAFNFYGKWFVPHFSFNSNVHIINSFFCLVFLLPLRRANIQVNSTNSLAWSIKNGQTKGWKEKQIGDQRSCDPRMYHSFVEACTQYWFQKACTTRHQRNPQIRRKRNAHERCSYWHPLEQAHLVQRYPVSKLQMWKPHIRIEWSKACLLIVHLCLNFHVYRSTPFRVRVRLARRRNDDEDSANKLYTLVTYVPAETFKGLQTENVESNDE